MLPSEDVLFETNSLQTKQNIRPVDGEYSSQCLSLFSPFGITFLNAESFSFLKRVSIINPIARYTSRGESKEIKFELPDGRGVAKGLPAGPI